MSPSLPTDEPRQSVEALLRPGGLYSDIFADSLPGIVVICDRTGKLLRWNRVVETITGYSADELGRMRCPDFFGDDSKALIEDKIHEALLQGEASIEVRLKTQDGRTIPFLLIKRRLDLEGGPFLVSMGIDISGRHHAQIALRESERKYRELVEHANSIILRWTQDGRVTFLNEYGLKFFGYTSEEIIGQHVMGTIVPEIESTNRDLRPLIKQIMKDPKAFEQNTNENMRRNGERVWIAWTNKTVLDDRGRIKEVLSIGTDITERRKAEEQVLEQAAFLDKARDAIVARDLDGSILFWNQGAERLYGWKREEVLGRHIGQLLHADPRLFDDINRQTLAKGEWTGELRHLTKSGGEIIVESRRTLIRDKSGQPRSVLVISTDITEKKKIEGQFLRAQRMESIGTLAGGIAHDLNNILAPILMAVELLKTRSPDPQSQVILETLGASAKRGADIVRQVLSFARGIEGQRIEVHPRHLLKDIEQIIQNTFPKDIRLKFSAPGDVWTTLGDPTQMHQVLLNLCVNARDAMPDGGELRVELENCVLDETSTVDPSARPGRYIKFSVIDEGTGMPPEILHKIFEPFFTTKEVNKGTGLGLSTVSAIVKSHGGLIHVHSELGKGTTFYVYFPASEFQSEVKTESPEDEKLPRGNGEIILVVDDETSILAVTGQMLRAFGYRVLVASDGEEALAIFRQHRKNIAAVLTDMRMPLMDGPTLIAALVQIDPEVRIITATGLDASGGLASAAGPGVKDSLVKPYTSGALLKTLRAVLDDKTVGSQR
jgi:PAS domain S-box-containing protein